MLISFCRALRGGEAKRGIEKGRTTSQSTVPVGANLFERAGVEVRDLKGVEVETLETSGADELALTREEDGLTREDEVEEERDECEMHFERMTSLLMGSFFKSSCYPL